MSKTFFKVLLLGAIVITSSGFISCSNDDMHDLENRVTVVEGLIGEIQEAISNAQVTGATITDASQDADGIWTLTLSNGTVVKINPATGGGGGSSITVQDNGSNMSITIDGVEYVLPKAPAAVTLIYSPQYDDGMEYLDATDLTPVQFMVNPAVTESDIASATFDIQEAHELKTRAGSSLFKVSGAVTYSNGFITVPIKGLALKPGATYAISVVMTLNSKQYISNYFRMKVAPDYSFVAEDDIVPTFSSAITDAAALTDASFYTATLPNGLLSDFNFKDYITNVPDGAEFVIAPMDAQNSDGANMYDLLKSSLNSSTGAFSLTGRPGTAFNPNDSKIPNGILVYVETNDQIRMKIWWKIVDPIANLDFVGIMGTVNAFGQHMEIRGAKDDGSDMLPAGVNDLDIPALMTDASQQQDPSVTDTNPVFPLIYDAASAFLTQAWQQYEVTYKDEGDVIKYDGTRYVTGEVGTQYAKFSRGVYWHSDQVSIASSCRRNDPTRPADEGNEANIAWCGGVCDGEIIGGYDGIPSEDRVKFGIDVNEAGHLVTTTNYKGWALRAGIWANYEYIYGDKSIGGDCLAFVWCNRRSCPTGPIQDPAQR